MLLRSANYRKSNQLPVRLRFIPYLNVTDRVRYIAAMTALIETQEAPVRLHAVWTYRCQCR
jgi:hypothetical protein